MQPSQPAPGAPVGIGYNACGDSFVGVDIIPGAHWVVSLWDSDHVSRIGYGSVAYEQPVFCVIIGYDGVTQSWNVQPPSSGFGQGATVQLDYELFNGDGTRIDFANQSNTYDEAGGLAFLETTPLNKPAGGGMTSEEHGWLDQVQQAVQRVFNDMNGIERSTPIGNALSHPDAALFNNPDAPFALTGRGELTPPASGSVISAYGLFLQATTVPSGFGRRDGVVVEWNERLAQLAAMHQIKTTTQEWVDEVYELHLDNTIWLWKTPFPGRVLYDVTPGCVVTAQWVRFSL